MGPRREGRGVALGGPNECAGLRVLDDRRVPGSRGNIDHIAIAPADVFVIDAKYYEGMIRVVDKGSFFRSDWRLTVGGHNKSGLAENMRWQVKAVTEVLVDAAVDPLPPVAAVLSLVDASFLILRRPKSFDDARIESDRSIVRLLVEPVTLQTDEIDRLARILAEALPSK